MKIWPVPIDFNTRLCCRKHPASALLLSFFMMSLLILVAISVSILVIRDLRTVRTVVAGLQSYYAAEGMSELALYSIKTNLPGYEPQFEDFVLSSGALAASSIHAREWEVPCVDQDADGWRPLSFNESVQIPLFAQIDMEGGHEKIDDFYVQFYVGDGEGDTWLPAPTTDVLRWKILGLVDAETEAISEYIPLDVSNLRIDKASPSTFGTVLLDASVPTGYSYAKYYKGGHPASFNETYPISDFLAEHSYNYLVLTNVLQEHSEAVIYFRFVSTVVEAVCEYNQIASEGEVEFGDTRQELLTLIKEGENLPVFDFVLYHTRQEEEGEVEDGGEEESASPFGSPVLIPLSSDQLFGNP